MGKNYYIFRHGETHATKTNRWYWRKLYSATILEEGKPSVIRLANYLKKIDSDYNISSPFIRCRQTVQLVEEVTGKKFAYDPRIGERTFQTPWGFRRRVTDFISEMEESKHKNIFICTHSAVIVVLINHLTIKNPTTREKNIAPRPGVLTIIKSGILEEIDFNAES